MTECGPLLRPADVWRARHLLRPHLSATPLFPSRALDDAPGEAEYWLKLETAHPTGSFKVRGAFSAMLQLSADCELITASSGNHAAACAHAAAILGRRITVVVPETTPESKLRGITRWGARLRRAGSVYDEAEKCAVALARRHNLHYLSAFSDRRVAAGAGTIALELAEQLPAIGGVVVPVGGGGLLAGVARALKCIDPGILVTGVQPEASCPMYRSLRAGRLVQVQHGPTLSEATAGGITPATLAMARRYADRVVTVTEEEIAAGIIHLALREKVVAEGAGALAVAAALAGPIPLSSSGPTVLLVTGSNIDGSHLRRILR